MRALIAVLALAGCASTELAGFIGEPVSSVTMAYGAPIASRALENGLTEYQYRWGAAAVAVPTSTMAGAPSVIVNAPGCIATIVAERNADGSEVVREVRPPREMIC